LEGFFFHTTQKLFARNLFKSSKKEKKDKKEKLN
jgi:hypothetical protein